MTEFIDFELQLTREGDRYMAEVRKSPAGTSPRVALQWPFGTEPYEMLLLKLENAVLKGRGSRAGPITSEEKVLREFGSDVFRAVFRNSEGVAHKFGASLQMLEQQEKRDQGMRVVLSIEPPELAMLPWEYMFDPKGHDAEGSYLCLRRPLVRYLNTTGPFSPGRIDGPLRILAMISNPGTEEWPALDVEKERFRIEESLSRFSRRDVHLEWVRGGSLDDLFDLVQRERWHVFHFIGHGGTDRYTEADGSVRAEGFVVMQDGQGGAAKVYASQLGLTLDPDRGLRLAVLNCCDSGHGSRGFSSVGAALVNSGVPLAVAMQYAITDGAAARFAGAFYKAIVAGQCVEQALTLARRYMRVESNVEWGIPVLFTRSGSCVLFDAEGRDPTLPTPKQKPASATPPAVTNEAREQLRRLFMS